jgi:RNA polymerase sigma-70 factor (ECF subfamily)
VSAAPDFRVLYGAELPYVLESLRRLGVRDGDLEDVAHEVFVTVYRQLPRYDPSRALRPWLFGIALRVAANYRRLARFRHESDRELPDLPGPAPAVDEQLAAAEARALLLEALDALDLDARAVLVMYELDEQPVSDIAVALGIPVNTVYSRLRLGRQRLNAAVRRVLLRRGEP